MKKLVQFQLEDGSPLCVEIEDQYGSQRATRGSSDDIEEAGSRFQEAVAKVRPAAEAVLKAFREMNTPDEISLDFGIKFGAKAGAFLASVDSEATFKVALKWKNPS